MTALAPPAQRTRPSRPARTHLHRLLRRRDELADLLAAHRSHALPKTDQRELWVALTRLEDYLRATHPRAYAIHLPAWLQRQAPGAHPRGGYHPACPLCPDSPAQQTVQNGTKG